MPHMRPLITVLAIAVGARSTNLQVADANTPSPAGPKLVNTCLITNNVKQLVDFYEPVLLLKASRSGDDYAEFRTGVGVLAIFSAEAHDKYIPGSAAAASNRSAILEFRVSNVDHEYTRLKSLVKTWVKPPTDQPWGTRSIYFRDSDGNLVDFYMPVNRAP